MRSDEANEVVRILEGTSVSVSYTFVNPKEVIFEENVRMNCFYCGHYNNNWRCPPRIPDIDYPKLFSEFDEGLLIALQYPIQQKEQFATIRHNSSVELLKLLWRLEEWMWAHDRANALSFGAGSCKLCKDGCGKEHCNNPYLARTALEAVGVNVVKTAKKYGVQVHFPPKNELMRVGLIVWQEGETES